MTNEVWKQIEGNYWVSTKGRVKNKKTGRFLQREESVWSKELNFNELTAKIHKNTKLVDNKMVRMDRGYVVASINGKQKRVHRLVANAFLSLDNYLESVHGMTKKQCKELPKEIRKILTDSLHVNHKDHDKTNNTLENLEWCTPQENAKSFKEHYSKIRTKRLEEKAEINNKIVMKFFE